MSAQSRSPEAAFDADLSGRILDLQLLRRVLGWLRPYRLTLLASSALVLLHSTLQVMLPIVLSLVVIDAIILGEPATGIPDLGLTEFTFALAERWDRHPLLAACAVYACLQLAVAVTGHWHRLTLISAVVRGLSDLRAALFSHLLRLPARFWDRVAVGRVTTRVTNDVEALYELLRGIGSLIGEFIPFFVALAIMLGIDASMTARLLLFAPVLAVLTFGFRRVSRGVFRRARQSLSLLNQRMQENLAGLTVVQLHNREEENLRRYMADNASNRRHETRAMTLETLFAQLNNSLSDLAVAVVLWLGAEAVGMDTISLGAIVLFTRYIDMLFQPIVALGDQYNLLFRAMASGERIFQALDWDERLHEPARPRTLPARLEGRIEIRDLHFGYTPGRPVLHGVDLTIEAGETLAIVGPTGSGKSTLIRLLARFYDIPDGAVRVDGIDVNAVRSEDLRRRIGVVLQDFHVFSGTIRDNITLGDTELPAERAEQAARLVGADAFIRRLPQGYDTELAERGQNLSQGQRQLLAFARVLAFDPEILVLDEATASIDPETEALLQRALDAVTRDRTAIVIAHRLQTVQDADRVLVLVDGRVEAIGAPAELLTSSPTYARLHAMQFQEI